MVLISKSKIDLVFLIAIILCLNYIFPNYIQARLTSYDTSNEYSDKLFDHVTFLSETAFPRNGDNLVVTEKYLQDHVPDIQQSSFGVGGRIYSNYYLSFGPQGVNPLLIGAHYDTFSITPGADDNASSVAVLLEVAKELKNKTLHREVNIVFWTNEEPPFFWTNNMGSVRFVAERAQRNELPHEVIALDMVGYFNRDGKAKRNILINTFFGNNYDYLAAVSNVHSRSFVRKITQHMNDNGIKMFGVSLLQSFEEIGFSDHSSFWKYDIPAIMITDGSFVRTPHYHKNSDTASTLDYEKMSSLVQALIAYSQQ